MPYMVMVADIVRWAKSQGIRVGLGRGSAAGCLISYLIGITAIDPIPWGLLFERFLNPGRKGLPDIDIDVQSDRRGEVKKYITERYGAEHVVDIITHERFQPKSVLQRLCRVYDVPIPESKAVTETIDIRQDDEETTLEELLPLNDKLKEFKAAYPEIWEHAIRLEGMVSNIGKHAAGIVITPEPVVNYMALERGKKGDLVTSWSDSADFMVISDNGFLKLDLLGIKGLQRHAYACKLIEKRHGKRIDLNKLSPLRDPIEVEPEVMRLFSDGFTVGLFQFSGKGITNLIRSIKPETALDLAAANALYRPGPMKGGVTWEYARLKNGQKEVSYWHPLVEPVLSESYGLVCYQEQVMEVAKRLGGFTPGQADDLRKAMGKLYRIKGGKAAKSFMAQYDSIWKSGTSERGIDKKTADEIWDKFLEFGHYGFNKSHSGSYSLEAYQDAWLKKHYQLEMYASILTYPSGSTPAAKLAFITDVVREAKARGIKFLPPDINKSDLAWTIDDDSLRFGLLGIKDVGEVAASKIILNRRFGYFSLDDLRQRCGSKVNKKVIEALTEAGAFDCWGLRDDWSAKRIAQAEHERLRMIIKGVSEADQYANVIRPNIYTQEEVERLPKGTEVIVGGEITKVDKKKTKTGKPFANVTVMFEMNEWRVKFWEQQLYIHEDLLREGNTIMVNGKKDEWNGYISVVASDCTDPAALVQEPEKEAA
jgi:DNA polymerase-3 subunit alpha